MDIENGQRNRWKGFVLGALGGTAGILAMRAYWQKVSEYLGYDPRNKEKENPEPQALEDISLVGKHYQKGESSTAAIGRIVYERATGKEPAEETKTALSYLVHWIISMQASGTYGAIQGQAGFPDVGGAIGLAVTLWLLGDELVQPMLGLTRGPTAYPAELHAHALGAHLAYGVASAAATQLLYKILP